MYLTCFVISLSNIRNAMKGIIWLKNLLVDEKLFSKSSISDSEIIFDKIDTPKIDLLFA